MPPKLSLLHYLRLKWALVSNLCIKFQIEESLATGLGEQVEVDGQLITFNCFPPIISSHISEHQLKKPFFN